MKTSFIWNIEDLTENQKQDIQTRTLDRISNIDYFEDKSIEITIGKNPQGGVNITASDGEVTLEGHYQDHQILGVSVVWAENPPLGIPQNL